MDFKLRDKITVNPAQADVFIEREIEPLEHENGNARFSIIALD